METVQVDCIYLALSDIVVVLNCLCIYQTLPVLPHTLDRQLNQFVVRLVPVGLEFDYPVGILKDIFVRKRLPSLQQVVLYPVEHLLEKKKRIIRFLEFLYCVAYRSIYLHLIITPLPFHFCGT